MIDNTAETIHATATYSGDTNNFGSSGTTLMTYYMVSETYDCGAGVPADNWQGFAGSQYTVDCGNAGYTYTCDDPCSPGVGYCGCRTSASISTFGTCSGGYSPAYQTITINGAVSISYGYAEFTC
jgi:hypothetical protein